MSISRALLLELLHDLTSDQAGVRRLAADRVTDIYRQTNELQALTISFTLATLAIGEASEDCREAQLHALVEMAGYEYIPATVLDLISTIDRNSLEGSSIEYYDVLTAIER